MIELCLKLKYISFLSLKIVFALANSVDPGKMTCISSGSTLFVKVLVCWFHFGKKVKILSAFYGCCIYSSALQTRFYCGCKQYEP